MPTERSFRELIDRVRAGDEGAATELVRRYEPAIRRASAGSVCATRGVNRLLDSMDICQSVLARALHAWFAHSSTRRTLILTRSVSEDSASDRLADASGWYQVCATRARSALEAMVGP